MQQILGVTEMPSEGTVGEAKLGECSQNSLPWHRPFGPRSFTSPISIIMMSP